jgi:ubiquitin carboxyl-terminal hydrolase 7
VKESLDLLCQPQVIEDYDTEVHGKQTVSRSLRFKETPPLLLLNINRIDFCHETFEPIKLNERYEFPEELDLANVVVKDGNADECRRPPTKYSLRAVIVHMGSAQMASYSQKSALY